jgi:hypothetical protein
LGQRKDYSAIAALEVRDTVYDERNPVTMDFARERTFRVRGIERVRLGTAYPDVVQRVRDVVNLPEIQTRCTLVVDATGVGTPVVELLKATRPGCQIVPVMITGGFEEGHAGSTYRVPKRDLITGLQAVVEQRRLEIARHSRAGRELIAELNAMRMSVSGFGRERFEAEGSRVHDDLVLAVSLAWWWVRRQGAEQLLG